MTTPLHFGGLASARHEQAVTVAKNLTKAQGVILLTLDHGEVKMAFRWPTEKLDKIPQLLRDLASQHEMELRAVLVGQRERMEQGKE